MAATPEPASVDGVGWLAGGRLRVITHRSVTLYDRALHATASCELPGSPGDTVRTSWASRDAEWLALYDERHNPLLFRSSDCTTRRLSFRGEVAVLSVDGDGHRYGLSKDTYFELHDIASGRLVGSRTLSRRSPSLRTLSGATLTANGRIMWLGAASVCDSDGDDCYYDSTIALDGPAVVEVRSHARIATLEGGVIPRAYAVSPNAARVALVAIDSCDVILAATASGLILDRATVAKDVGPVDPQLRFSVEGDRLAIVVGGSVAIFDVTGDRLRRVGSLP
jgi:hypothetical protein